MIVRAMEAIAMVTVAIYSYCHGNCCYIAIAMVTV